MSAAEPILQVHDLRTHLPVRGGFGRRAVVRAVDGVTFDVRPGTTFGIVGESGCGKSTLARTIVRLVPAAGGEIRFEHRDVLGLSGAALQQYRRSVQIVFQDPAGSLNPRMTVDEIVGEALTVHRIATSRAKRAEIVIDMLRRVGLSPDDRARYPHEFSGGQRQRIGIARALALRPRLVICDEPVSALDVSIQSQILNLLRDLQAEFGLSYLFIAHNLAVMRQICDEIAVMYLGRIVEHATTAELFDDPRHPYTRALIESAPRLDVGAPRRMRVLAGDPPNPIDPPPGCAFHPRCPVAVPACMRDVPSLELCAAPRSSHRVACPPMNPRITNSTPQAVQSSRSVAD
jgi:oligopeptide transport system ATP-binding protein